MSENLLQLDPNEYGDFERFYETAKRIGRWYDALGNFAWAEKPQLEKGEDLVRQVEIHNLLHEEKVCQEFCDAYQGKGDFAGKEEVAEHIGNLLDCYPSTKIPNPRVYVQTLVEEVYSMLCERAVIEMACRDLKRTCKTPPSIAVVREAIQKREKEWEGVYIWGLAEVLQEARDVISKLKESVNQTQAATPAGQRVKHEKFGVGTVVERDGARITVDFGYSGRKELLAAYVIPLEDE